MSDSQPNVTKERSPYSWLRYLELVDLAKVTDVRSLQFAIEELPECIAYHENWIRDAPQLMTDLRWLTDIRREISTLEVALAAAKNQLSDLSGAKADTFTCDKCGNEVSFRNGCDDEQPETCDDCYEVKNDQ